MFAGGGVMPFEAARLGCESHAVAYNPVAYLSELCTLVCTQTFDPSLADDFQRRSAAILGRMAVEIGVLYPLFKMPQTEGASTIARRLRCSMGALTTQVRASGGAGHTTRVSWSRSVSSCIIPALEPRFDVVNGADDLVQGGDPTSLFEADNFVRF